MSSTSRYRRMAFTSSSADGSAVSPRTACGQPASQDHPDTGHLGRHAATGPCHRLSLQALAAPFTGPQLAWVQARCRTYADSKEIFLHAVCPVIWSQRCTPRVQRQPRLSTALKRPDLAEHRGTNAITCRVAVGGQPSGNGGEDLRRLGAVVLRACGLGEAVHI